MEWLIDIGIAALLRIVKDRRERSKWAKALAKVFVAIEDASVEDNTLMHAIQLKRAEEK
jgi:hypothetical protein